MMDKDKAIRAAKLTVKQVRADKASENIADYVAELLRQGRASEVTDDLMEQADPQRLHHHYTTGNTGVDMPMDYASRMARAEQMGMETKTYHGTRRDFPHVDLGAPRQTDNGWFGRAHYSSPDPKLASGYAGEHTGSSVMPQRVAMQEPWVTTHHMINQMGVDQIRKDTGADTIVRTEDERLPISGAREIASYDPTNIRSQFARFDPRLSHLSHLSASTGGAMELARAVVAKNRAGGQIAPSKYLPNVPRAVHADGGRENGKAAFQQGNHPDVPDVVYHGTQSDIQTFRQSQTGEFGPGIYMTDLPEEAADYAGTHPFAGKGPNVMPLHLSMKNPFVVKSDPQEFWQRFGGKWDEDAQKNAIAAGHDGVIFRRPYMKWDDSLKREVPTGKHHTHFVAFNPTQVKSAISAKNFDPTNPDITKSGGGSVTDTDEFRNWFGNSVTHTNGEPHVLYTGTSKDKDFTSHNVGRHGAWFVRDPEAASSYAEQNDSQGYKREGFKLTPTNTASRVIPAYVRAENPYTGELPEEYLRDNYKAAQSDWFDTLRAKGHDSWIPASQNGNLVVALKEPQQIKSIWNNGKFDPKQKHMNKAGGGRVGYEDGGEAMKDIQSPKAAKLALNVASDKWHSSDNGSVSPEQFANAIKNSDYASTLSQYSPKDVDSMVKSGQMQLHKLKDGEIYFGLKNGTDYGDDYGFHHPELSNNEKALVSVVNNEPDAKGIGGAPVVLHAIRNGATALDAYAVPSDKHPDGFLPDFYRKFGFEELGRIPFDPQYVTQEQLTDMKNSWKSQGWDESRHPMPSLAIMKWKGKESDRPDAVRRYIAEGSAHYRPQAGDADVQGAVRNAQQGTGLPTSQIQVGGGSARPSDFGAVRDDRPTRPADRLSRTLDATLNLQPHEASALGVDPNDVEEARKSMAGPFKPITSFKSGGKAMALTRRFTKNGIGATIALKPRGK